MNRTIYSLLVAILLVPVSGALGQTEMFSPLSQGTPNFQLTMQNTAGPGDSSSLMISLRVPYDELLFLKTRNQEYRAKAEIVLILHDENNDEAYNKSHFETIHTTHYDSTQSNTLYHRFSTTVDMEPGDYTFRCQVTDMDSRSTASMVRKITLEDFASEPLAMSDISLIASSQLSQEHQDMIGEMFEKQLDGATNFVVARFEVYSRGEDDNLKIGYQLMNFRSNSVEKGNVSFPRQGYRTVVFLPFSTDLFSGGVHMVSLKIDDGATKADFEKRIRTRFSASPFLPNNLQNAIEQMRYIAGKKDVQQILKAPPELQKKLFKKFWAEKDPSPETPINELMNEYYQRVAFANQHFSSHRPGWKTDMGMVFILFGQPSDVEREPYNVQSSPFSSREIHSYELWYYYDINRQFAFADYSGFGEFYLLNPDALWDR